jgi:MraZ protein
MMVAAQRRRGSVFLGEYSHSLDEKGRVVMPSKFRMGLDDGCVVTKGQERCIYVFPMDRWEEESSKVLKLPRTDRRARNFSRSFFASASDQALDRQGRVQIPESLRRYAGLEKDLTVVGVADRIEVWAADTWRTVAEEADAYYSEIEEALSEDGI